ncbi:structural maintenance of chromosomes protein 4-like [Magnolia sinica]|uniref:structural maintenance of chromosomes protein 4-like n=1 Tax=Magnolia sinica TaxID=86752 RepID=UPI0026586BC9|nr:structural maintenance of chromosomes protein 4-like [Magnolia sinica]
MYYEGGISSVYMWKDNEDFVACFLIKKDGSKSGHGRRSYLQEGAWDAIHVIENDGIYEVVAGSDFVITKVAFRNNSSKYNINDRGSNFTEVTKKLKGKEVDLDNNWFYILQVGDG